MCIQKHMRTHTHTHTHTHTQILKTAWSSGQRQQQEADAAAAAPATDAQQQSLALVMEEPLAWLPPTYAAVALRLQMLDAALYYAPETRFVCVCVCVCVLGNAGEWQWPGMVKCAELYACVHVVQLCTLSCFYSLELLLPE